MVKYVFSNTVMSILLSRNVISTELCEFSELLEKKSFAQET